jgi:predicted RNA-binding protein
MFFIGSWKNMVNYWLCVTNEDNWRVIRKENMWGVSDIHQDKLTQTKVGDRLVFYVKPMRIGGIFEVIAEPFQEDKEIFLGGVYPHRIRLKPIIIPDKFLDFRPLISELRFIKKKSPRWGAYLQGKAMRTIQKEDYELIKNKLKELRAH